MKKAIVILLSILTVTVLIPPLCVNAIENPQARPNNIFGIHILDETDLEDAAKLVNSGGGDWGYVTLVIRKDERDIVRWQKVFDNMRRLHLVPIVRIATRQANSHWEKPSVDEIDGWVSFLDSLNWVIKNRYVIIGNEPNHASEWGNEIKPEEYADYFYNFSENMKNESQNFFILSAGFDASAPTDKTHMSEDEYIERMLDHNADVFKYIDGWSSHSYPNPDFSGSESETGRGTVATFIWELELLKTLGVEKELPVFITETGWAHNKYDKVLGYKNPDTISESLKYAYENVWNDKKIVAVTPFVLNYKDPPFDIFSWRKKDGGFYNFYYDMQRLPKIAGRPIQEVKTKLLSFIFPPVIKRHNKFYGLAFVKNEGQSIWKWGEFVNPFDGRLDIQYIPLLFFFNGEPGQRALAIIRIGK
ncbi:MAG: hypothetical protein JXA96_01225 [Sedimentisphaerales bacterium]|nr:hypothetical protein [Sedimentisphaerales bacterium]